MYIFQCEDSIDGIFTGIYDAWASHYGHKNIQLSTDQSGDITLFSEYIQITTDYEKSKKVSNTLIRRLGMDFFEIICKCAMAEGNSRKLPMDKATAIYQTVVMALSLPEAEKVLEYLGEPCIACIFELCRQTQNEGHQFLGFLRFRELQSGILFAEIHPTNDILPILAAHFSNRLPLDDFVIYDATHHTAAIHKASHGYFITDSISLNLDLTNRLSLDEERYQKLWCTFFNNISIDARYNPKLQSQNIPKRFWPDTIELPQSTTK